MAKVINTVLSLKDDFSTTLSKVQKNAEKAVGRIKGAIEKADSPTAKLSTGFKAVGAEVTKMGQAFMPASMAATGALAASTKAAADFEQAMQNTWSIAKSSNEGSAAAFKTLQDAAKAAGEQGYYSASQAADALGYMALAGWDAEKSASALPDVLNLAAAAGMELAEASDIVTDYMSAFGNTTMSTTQFTDMLSYAQNNANTTVEQLSEAYKNCAANLNAAGQDAYTVTSMLEAMANQGAKGSEAGTKLTAIMRDLTAKMKDGSVQIGETSVAVQDASGNYRDLTDILRDVDAATQGLGTAERTAALSSVFTRDSIAGVNLVLNEGIDTVAGYEEALRNSEGAAADAAAEKQESLYGALNRVKNQFGTLAMDIGSQFLPILKSLSDKLSAAAEKFNGLSDRTKTTIAVVMAVVAAIGPGLIILGSLISAIGTVIGAIGAVITAIGGVTTVLGVAFAVIAANPVVLVVGSIIAAVVALSVAVYKNWDSIKAAISNGVNTIKGLWESLKAAASAVIDTIKSAVSAGIAIITTVWEAFWTVQTARWNAFKAVATAVITVVKTVVSAAISTISALWEGFWSTQTSRWNGLKSVVSGVINAIKSTVSAGFSAVRSTIESAISSAKSTLTSGFNAMKNSASSVVDGIVSKFESFKSRLGSIVSSIKDKVSSITGAISNVTGFITGHATGTPYFTGGLTTVNEYGGEIINLPSGTQIIPHDLSKQQVSKAGVTVNVTVQGNVIGNSEYTEYLGRVISSRVIAAMNNV